MSYQAANLHMEFKIVTVHTAKCDVCNKRNKNTLKRCETCGYSVCGPCFLDRSYDSGHLINTGDTSWTVARASMPLKETTETTKAGSSKKTKAQQVEKRPAKAKASRKPAAKQATASKAIPKSKNERPFKETEALCQNAEALGDENVLTRPRLRIRAPKQLATGNSTAKSTQAQPKSAKKIVEVERHVTFDEPVPGEEIASGDSTITQSPTDRHHGWMPINVPSLSSRISGIDLLLDAAASIDKPELKQDIALPGISGNLELELVHKPARIGQGTKSNFNLSGVCSVDLGVAKHLPHKSLPNSSLESEEASALPIAPLVSPRISQLDIAQLDISSAPSLKETVPDDDHSDSLFFPDHNLARNAIERIPASPSVRQDLFEGGNDAYSMGTVDDLHPSVYSKSLGDKRHHGGFVVDLTEEDDDFPIWESSSIGNNSRESKRPRLSAVGDQALELSDEATVTHRMRSNDDHTEKNRSLDSSMTSNQFGSAIMSSAAPLSRNLLSRVHLDKGLHPMEEVLRQDIRDEMYLEILSEVCKELRERLKTLHRGAMPEPVDKLRAMRERTLRSSMNPVELSKREALMKEVAELERMIRRTSNLPPTSLGLSPYAL